MPKRKVLPTHPPGKRLPPLEKGGGAVGVITSVEAVKQFFSTPEKPVTFQELKELGSAGIKDLARECAPVLGVQLKNQTE